MPGKKAKQPRDVDPTAKELLASYHDATPEQKAAMIEKFKAPNGKKLAWATEFISKEVEHTADVEKTVENWFTGNEILKMNGVEIAHLEDRPPPPPFPPKNNTCPNSGT